VSAGRIRLTVLPLGTATRPRVTEVAVQEVLQELERTGRFQIAFGDQVLAWLGTEKIGPDDFIKGQGVPEALQKFNLAHLLALHFSVVDNKLFMEARLVSRSAPAPLLQTSLLVPSSVRPKPAQQFSSGGGGEVKVEKRSLLARLLSGDWEPNKYSAGASSIPVRLVATFPFLVHAMDVATAPADRQPRLVVTDGQKVYVYRITGDKLDAEWTYDKMMVGRIIGVQFADLDADGQLEVIVNRQDVKAGMISFVLTVRQGRPGQRPGGGHPRLRARHLPAHRRDLLQHRRQGQPGPGLRRREQPAPHRGRRQRDVALAHRGGRRHRARSGPHPDVPDQRRQVLQDGA
jgi:hypothetical protein